MELKINQERLQQTLDRLLDKVCGCCSQAGVAIGEVDGKEIYLSVTDDDEEKRGLHEQYKCVEESIVAVMPVAVQQAGLAALDATVEAVKREQLADDEIKGKLLHLMDGLDNCIASAKENGDNYGEGYMSAMAKELKEVFVALFGELEEEEGV